MLHLYTPDRGRVGAVAKGVRRVKSRFGGRLEPLSRVRLVLHQGRGELCTVSQADTLHAHASLRERRASLERATQACEAVLRLFDSTEPNRPAYNLLCHELALLDAERRGRRPRPGARVPAQAAAGGRLRAGARRRAPPAARPSTWAPSPPSAGGVVCAGCEAGSFPLGEEAHRFLVDGARQAARRGPAGARAGAGAGRPGDRRDARVPRPRAVEARRVGAYSRPVKTAAGTKLRLRLRRGLARHARAARRQGRQRRRDDARARAPSACRPGFTITTEACVAYMEADRALPEGLEEQVAEALERLEEQAGKRLGDADDPLLVSVRSGARESMPGMMDTVLNLGLERRVGRGARAATGNERFAWDSYRRFVQMFGNVCRGIPGERSRTRSRSASERRRRARHRARRRRPEGARRRASRRSSATRPARSSRRTRASSCAQAIRAVFDSWMGERAVSVPAHQPHPRRVGHRGERAADGVRQQGRRRRAPASPSRATRSPASRRRPATSSSNAQGEDVVSGVRTPRDIARAGGGDARGLRRADGDPAHARGATTSDMQDTEFTVEEGTPLHAPDAQREAPGAGGGALRGRRGRGGAARQARRRSRTIDAGALDALLHPAFDPRRRVRGARAGASPRRRAPPRARSCSPPPTRWRRPRTGAT